MRIAQEAVPDATTPIHHSRAMPAVFAKPAANRSVSNVCNGTSARTSLITGRYATLH